LLAAGFLTLVVGSREWRATTRQEGGSVGRGVLAKVAAVATGAAALPALGWVFLKTGALLFGGGYVLIPLLQPEVVSRGWLTESQFLDGIALGQATPGPIVTTSAFVGYGVSGVAGALVATVAIYLPAFVVVMAGTGPFLRSLQAKPWLRHFTRGVNAAALGAIAGAGVALTPTALGSPFRVVIGLLAAVALLRKVPIWVVLPAGAAIGLAAGAAGWT
jgi:chromate transporter